MSTSLSPRAANFTMFEKELLSELLKKYTAILTKNKDSHSVRQKEEQWKKLVDEFNADSQVTKREPDSIRVCLKNLTSKAKKEHALKKKDMFQTGGGSTSCELSGPSNVLVGLMPETFQPLHVPDSDDGPMVSFPSPIEGENHFHCKLLARDVQIKY
jgi:hypothetical protein